MKKLTLVPNAGLCNRLYAITSAVVFKQTYPGVDVNIYWYKWFNCNCRFHDLFKPLPQEMPQVKELYFSIANVPGHRLNLYIPQRIRGLFYDASILSELDKDGFDRIMKESEKVYVNKDCPFWEGYISESLAKIFRPADDIQRRIDDITTGWNGNVVGLHIRRTDNLRAIQQTPMEYFVSIIDKELQSDDRIRFYVATDDATVKEYLKGKFGEHILTEEFCLKRNSLQGMKDAVVDLYCLGSTSKIYGSSASTYSLCASQLFNRPLIV